MEYGESYWRCKITKVCQFVSLGDSSCLVVVITFGSCLYEYVWHRSCVDFKRRQAFAYRGNVYMNAQQLQNLPALLSQTY